MNHRFWRAGALILIALALVACGKPSKHDILQRAEGVKRKSELLEKLGEPSERGKLGPIETWSYAAKDGEVTFVVIGERVSIKTTGDADEPKDSGQ